MYALARFEPAISRSSDDDHYTTPPGQNGAIFFPSWAISNKTLIFYKKITHSSPQ
jgi:hypothetical protein